MIIVGIVTKKELDDIDLIIKSLLIRDRIKFLAEQGVNYGNRKR